MNNVNLFGRVGQDIVLSTASNNRHMVKFWLAVNEGGRTDWIPCTAWGSRAELIAKYVCKGDRLIINGRLRPREYTGKDEIKRWDMPVEIQHVTFVSGNRAGPGPDSRPNPGDFPNGAPASEPFTDSEPEEIPDDAPEEADTP